MKAKTATASSKYSNYDVVVKDTAKTPQPLTANELLKQFLHDNHIILVPDRHESGTYFVEDGFVLNDKPQLKLKAVYEHEER